MKIEDIVSTLSKREGLAKPNRYRVFIEGNRDLNTLCDSVTLPGRAISTNEYTNGKQFYKTPYTFINSEVNMSFMLTNDYYVREYFDKWMNDVIDPEGFTVKYKNEYVRDIVIEQLNEYEKVVYSVKLLKAYPLNISEINLSNTEENTTAKLEVSFAYDNFVKI